MLLTTEIVTIGGMLWLGVSTDSVALRHVINANLVPKGIPGRRDH